jgi:serine protease SohB
VLEFLAEYGLFLAKVITVLGAVLIVIGALFSGSQKHKKEHDGDIKTKHLNKELKKIKEHINDVLLNDEQHKQLVKQEKKEEKERKKKEKAQAKNKEVEEVGRIFVIDFDGDKEGNQVDNLRKEVTAVLGVANKVDEIVVRVESPGGMVHTYGLAAAQLERIKNSGIKLTISVDKVAASGGYLMACIADKLIAAPFAIVGSVGVLVEITNFNKLLKKNDIDVEVLTAGEYKHTISMLGEITPEAREKTIAELAAVHEMFKNFVMKYRPQLDIEKVATGEYWHGSQAIDLNMIDELLTSDEYLCSKCNEEVEVYELEYKQKETLGDKLGFSLSTTLDHLSRALLKKLNRPLT